MIRRTSQLAALLLMGYAFGTLMAIPDKVNKRSDALECARSNVAAGAASDSDIARCYLERGLPVPGMLD